MKIDAHQHFWTYDPETFAWLTDDMAAIRKSFQPEDLKPVLDYYAFDGCVFVQVNQTEQETLHFHEVALQNPFIRGVVGWTDLFSDRLEENLEKYAGMEKVKGFRHIVQGEPAGFMKNPQFVEAVKKLSRYDFTYDILIYPPQLKDAVFIARSCPDTRFVLDHMAKPLIREGKVTQWANYIRELAAHPNVFCKVSGLVTEADYHHWKKEDFYIYLDMVLNAFGADRLLYGSDWPVCLVAATYEEQLDILESYFSGLSETEKAGIFGENARQVYRL
ncbi:amidohydrolase [Leadbetterella sp. DM7]|uniref:amidohydrolase family protein n=1 Tax=Leadbetterella sp. DM7 TaxID=3235085 RepID=UPI00349E73CE